MRLLNYLRIMIRVVILGGGNVAYHLTNKFLKNSIVNVVQVYNRSLDKIIHLKSKVLITCSLNELKEADIYIIAVSDDAIANISSKIKFKDKLVVHTSGSTTMEDLESKSRKGVFYLLHTFSKEREVDFSNIPVCIEASHKKDMVLLEKLAKSISNNLYYIDSNQRKYLHIAAVFVNNFVNHLYHIGNGICEQNNIPFEILKPIIQETAAKIISLQPIDAQTGPAIRNDSDTIEKHTTMLTQNQQEIYTLLTKSIYQTYGKKL